MTTADMVSLGATLRRLFETDVTEGTRVWLSSYASAIFSGDLTTSGWLVEASHAFPADLAPLVASHFRPANDALGAGRRTEASGLLSLGSSALAEVIALLLTPSEAGTIDTTLSEARRHEVNAAWLERAGATAAAATSYYEAGRSYSWSRDVEAAVRVLDRAVSLAPRHAAAYWYLADVWLSRTFSAEPPYVEPVALDRSLAAWDRGADLESPGAPMSWAYVTRALISEQQARLHDDRREHFWWEAAGFLECALLLDASDALRWASLARVHRLLEIEACALYAAQQAVDRSPDEASALEEKAAILANLGVSDEARATIDKRLAQDANNTWALGLKAYVHLHEADYATALELIDRVIAADPLSLWNLGVRGAICSRSGDKAGARQADEAIWSRYRPAMSADDRRTCASAAFQLGYVDQAIAILEPLLGERLQRAYTLRTLGVCHLAKGSLERGEPLVLSGLARASGREVDDFLAEDLADVERKAPAWVTAPGGLASYARVKRTASALAAELRRAPAPDSAVAAEAELRLVQQELPASETAAGTAIRAALARLCIADDRLSEAAALYRQLLSAPGRFPEARLGTQRTLERLGEQRLRAGRTAEALAQFQDALAAGGEAGIRAGLHVRAAMALERQSDSDGAGAAYEDALRLFAEVDAGQPGVLLARATRPLLQDAAAYWAVDTTWEHLARSATTGDARAAFSDARRELSQFLNDLFRLQSHEDPAVALPFITPVALEVANHLVPLVDPQVDGGKFINQDIAAMRDRIAAGMGLTVPGIRVRGSWTAEGYVVLVDEVAVANGRVEVGSRFCPAPPGELQALGLDPTQVVAARHPATGAWGAWCPADSADVLAARGFALQTETEFILSHVEHVLRQRLATFVGIEETQTILTSLQKDPRHVEFATRVSGDDGMRLSLSRVLRALAREQVPVTDWPRIIEAIGSRDLTNVDEIVRPVRLALRNQLPGNQRGATYLQVPAHWEALVVRQSTGEPAFGVTPWRAHQMLVDVRAWLAPQREPVTLVTRTTELRPFVRRLIAFEFPSVAVLSLDEVVPGPTVVPAEPVTSADDAGQEGTIR